MRDTKPTSLFANARFRFCCRVTTSAVLAFAVAELFAIPLHGLWAVLTAVVVTQMSVGGSLNATSEYVIGTFGGAVYASAVAMLIPHITALAMAGVLALAIAPLAYAAACSPSFRVAPFTAVIVLLISSQFREGPIESAFYRLLEVALGGSVAVAVSLVVFPARAPGIGLSAAARVIEQLAGVLPRLLRAFQQKMDELENRNIQDETGKALDAFEGVVDEAKRERLISLVAEPDPAVLARTLLRLRHDIVLIGRAGIAPLPATIRDRLAPLLTRIGATASEFLLASRSALTLRRSPPPLDSIDNALADYTREIAAIRAEGLLQALPSSELERIFTLGFALEQLLQHLSDLARCEQDWRKAPI
jgi:uncharacterized membrane protein YccC